MKNRILFFAFLLLCTAAALAAADDDPLPDADAVVAKMLVQDGQRQTLRGGYRGMRQYVLENGQLHKHAEMRVRVQCDAEGTKHFEVIDEQGWKAAQKHVLHKMLDSEAEASTPQVHMKTRMSPENYQFRMVSKAPLDGRMTYAVDITPKRREERLFEGRIWIDAEDYALVRAEGKPAKNPSFWTRSVHFVHTYRKSGSFWFPASTDSVTDVRIFGSTNLNIHYFDYTPTPLPASEAASVALQGRIPQ